MREHEGQPQRKNEKAEQNALAKPRENLPSSDQSNIGNQGLNVLNETPFYPHLNEHIALLARAVSSEQQGNLVSHLQRVYGNNYVQRLLSSQTIQTRLSVSSPQDRSEQKADHVADKVTGQIEHKVQRQGNDDEDQSEVSDWAKQEYIRESKMVLTCSMTPDGMIGSVYFDQGRIRMTHSGGPEEKQHQNQITVRFNVDQVEAQAEFDAYLRDILNKMDDQKRAEVEAELFDKNRETKAYWKQYRKWLAELLKDKTVDNAPKWATKVEGPDTAIVSQNDIPKNVELFEIFKNINGRVETWHPSRGAAVKFETDKQTISVLHAAIEYINGEGLTDPGERNEEFYDFVAHRLPNFIQNIRRPDEV
jgi:hypothetical protein